MKQILFFLFFCVGALNGAQTPEEALQRLKEGNKRFVDETLLHPDRTHERRESLAEGQFPYAVIVACSDSRVVPEVIFDEGLGDLFVIRVAGNVVGPTELESIEYAVGHLHPEIVVVMGHEKCGAVDAVAKGDTKGIATIAKYIKPSVKKAKSMDPKDLLELSVKLNALRMRTFILKSPVVNQRNQEKEIGVYSAYYNLPTGVVDFLD